MDDTSWLVNYIDNHDEGLTKWGIGFIANMIDNSPNIYSDKQSKTIDKIYERRCPWETRYV